MLTDEDIDALWPDITMPQKVVRREIARAVIAANNAKVLEKLEPAYQLQKIDIAYSVEQVAALIQERADEIRKLKEQL